MTVPEEKSLKVAQRLKPQENERGERTTCGLIMPISAIDGCTEQHWQDVQDILSETIRTAGLEPNLVSDADDVGIIQKRIIQNLYTNPIVICDVSGKNPNVMFELGVRLAFDKPTIIVKDDQTSYSFDTASIEHLTYPRDLRFNKIVKFKEELAAKVGGTLEKAGKDPQFSTFLKNFGKFTVAQLDTTTIPQGDYILEEITELRRQVTALVGRRSPSERERLSENRCKRMLEDAVQKLSMSIPASVLSKASRQPEVALELCQGLHLLPKCFNPKRRPCTERFEDAISRLLAGTPDEPKRVFMESRGNS